MNVVENFKLWEIIPVKGYFLFNLEYKKYKNDMEELQHFSLFKYYIKQVYLFYLIVEESFNLKLNFGVENSNTLMALKHI